MKKTESLSAEGVCALLDLPNDTDEELRDTSMMVWTCFTSMRLEDMDFAKSDEIKQVLADKTNPRRLVAVLKRTKNDKTGNGPVAGRTFVLPCICLEGMGKEEKKKFVKLLKNDPDCSCATKCPYGIFLRYLKTCPSTPDGSFLRALTSRGNPRTLATNKSGMNTAAKSFAKVLFLKI